MAGSAGTGRPKGARNRRTLEAHALIGEGETPVEVGLRLMRDETVPPDLRIHAARIGRQADARAAVEKMLQSTPAVTIQSWRQAWSFRDTSILDQAAADLALAGLPKQ